MNLQNYFIFFLFIFLKEKKIILNNNSFITKKKFSLLKWIVFIMELKLSEGLKDVLVPFLLIVLPLIFIVIALVVEFWNGWYFIGMIFWFCMGVIFQCAID